MAFLMRNWNSEAGWLYTVKVLLLPQRVLWYNTKVKKLSCEPGMPDPGLCHEPSWQSYGKQLPLHLQNGVNNSHLPGLLQGQGQRNQRDMFYTLGKHQYEQLARPQVDQPANIKQEA